MRLVTGITLELAMTERRISATEEAIEPWRPTFRSKRSAATIVTDCVARGEI
jgi:hypothetical protein